jgi:hypothetical protein
MSARFRIRTPTGQELSFASVDVFREFVRSGDLSPDDVVYDAETREWSSARTHPVVLEIESEAASREEAAEPRAPVAGGAEDFGGVDAPAPTESVPTFSMGDIGLDLAPATQLSPDEEAAAFVAKLEAERAADLSHDVPIQSFSMEQDSPAPARAAPPPPAPRESTPRSFRQERPAPTARPAPASPATKPSAALRYAPVALLIVILVGAGVYIGPALFSAATARSGDAEAVPPEVTPPPAPVIPATNDAIRGRANERFLSSTQNLMRRLEPIPATWLGGRYLSSPSDFDHVRQVWENYVTTIREIRAGDEERFRAAYLRALDDAGVRDAARETRLATGMAEFRGTAAARARHYDRVETLATVAISAHQELLAAEGRILYEPATGPRVSSDPVIEAVGRTPADQELLEEILDAILAELRSAGGAGSAPNVREWAYGGLLDAVTN